MHTDWLWRIQTEANTNTNQSDFQIVQLHLKKNSIFFVIKKDFKLVSYKT